HGEPSPGRKPRHGTHYEWHPDVGELVRPESLAFQQAHGAGPRRLGKVLIANERRIADHTIERLAGIAVEPSKKVRALNRTCGLYPPKALKPGDGLFGFHRSYLDAAELPCCRLIPATQIPQTQSRGFQKNPIAATWLQDPVPTCSDGPGAQPSRQRMRRVVA